MWEREKGRDKKSDHGRKNKDRDKHRDSDRKSDIPLLRVRG